MKTYSVCIQTVLRVAIGLSVVAWVANAAQAQMGAHAVSDPPPAESSARGNLETITE